MDAVSTVLADRLRPAPGFGRMVGCSFALHVAAGLALIVASALRTPAVFDLPKTIMTVSLAGGPGPRAGGANPLGGRPVQTTAPLPEPKRPEPLRPPAAKTPEMAMPAAAAKRVAKPAEPAPVVKSAPDEARGRTPVRGDQEQFGSAIAETGAQGFGGLSTGGGGTRGIVDDVDGSFCCPEYLGVMQQRIQANWNSRQEVAGSALIRFRILRDGTIVDLEIERSSGFYALDYAGQRALVATKKLPPLPTAFPNSSLTVHLMFDYLR
jgi:protein TonB